MDALAGLILIAGIIISIIIYVSNKNSDPRDSAAGRWGIKAGKVARGEFGGKKWGER